MGNIIKSSLYKLTKEAAFKVTLIIGVSLAIGLTLIMFGISSISLKEGETPALCNGVYNLFSSSSPTSNFGLAVPINLAVLIVGEFSCGTVRNKVIAGYSKTKIYFGMLITGLLFTIVMMTIYIGLSVGLGTLLGGFHASGDALANFGTKEILLYCLLIFIGYVFVACFSVFIGTTLRSTGGSIGVIIGTLMFFMVFTMVVALAINNDTVKKIFACLNPLYLQSGGTLATMVLPTLFKDSFYVTAGVLSPLLYSVLFTTLGIFLFNKRDLK